jgi:hypothetical protein
MKDNQAFCAACGHPAGKPVIAKSAEAVEYAKFERAVRQLSRFWYLFAGLSVILGAIGLFAIQTELTTHTGPWEPWPHPYIWNWTLFGSAAWMLFATRVALALASGWCLQRQTDWGRPVAIFAGALAFTQFPIGVVLGVYTLSMLLGKRRATLYDRIAESTKNLVGVR